MLPNTVLAFDTNRDGDLEIYLLDVDHDIALNLTRNRADDTMPVWSPDGSQILFVSTRSRFRNLYVMDADGRNVRRLTNDQYWYNDMPAWSPDGTQIAYQTEVGGDWDIFVMDADGENVRN